MLPAMKAQSRRDEDAIARLRRVEADVERQIADAIERGELDGLDGHGRPLPRDPDDAAGERWAAAHVLRKANAVPEWVELRKRVFTEREALVRKIRARREWRQARRAALGRVRAEDLLEHARATEAADRRFQLELEGAVRDLNARIARHNLLVAAQVLQLSPVTLDRLRELADGSTPR
jgi:hypothetical protein